MFPRIERRARHRAHVEGDRRGLRIRGIGEELVAEVKRIGYSIGLCDSPLFANLLTSIRQASDIVADGSQDPTKTCNGISIGLGFEMGEVQLGAVGPVVPVAMSCP